MAAGLSKDLKSPEPYQGLQGASLQYASGGGYGYAIPVMHYHGTSGAAQSWMFPNSHSTTPVGQQGIFISIKGLTTETVAFKMFDSPTQTTGVTVTPIVATTGKLAASASLGVGQYILPKGVWPWKLTSTKSSTSETVSIAVGVMTMPK